MIVSIHQESPLARLQDWYRTPLGQGVARLECASVQRLLNTTFGYYLVQIGATEAFRDVLAASRIRHRILMPIEPPGTAGAQVLGAADQLPFASDSIDAVLLPHTLDFAADPRAVVAEVERVLIPEGRVLVVGFNALSPWGLRRLLWRSKGRMPWCGRFHLSTQVRDLLAEHGCDLECCEYSLFCPPLARFQGGRCSAFDAIGRRFWPALGAVYVIRAVKRVATVTPLRPRLTNPSALLSGRAVRPTTRGTGHV
ncbi:class I SAM-dependent methyltransferase [Imhoffiella purpurea]|uniref:SAM-dependent methyltransferase n=1 Tax=Imhoffiella purpurea TaxID=1249627 RepID=W9VGV8_9GAMM|nr:methyltransferase domain-containing protein [Imhoffiella purpurea]EXJ16256.1 SAM-dependent methyltransferase [Imhoffiella purpurea]